MLTSSFILKHLCHFCAHLCLMLSVLLHCNAPSAVNLIVSIRFTLQIRKFISDISSCEKMENAFHALTLYIASTADCKQRANNKMFSIFLLYVRNIIIANFLEILRYHSPPSNTS